MTGASDGVAVVPGFVIEESLDGAAPGLQAASANKTIEHRIVLYFCVLS
jgi:hypothetical protein